MVEPATSCSLLAQLAHILDPPQAQETAKLELILSTLLNNESTLIQQMQKHAMLVDAVRTMQHDVNTLKSRVVGGEEREMAGFLLLSHLPRAITKGKSFTLRFCLIDKKGAKWGLAQPLECVLCLEEYSSKDSSRAPLFTKTWSAHTNANHEVEFNHVFIPLSARTAAKTKLAITISIPTNKAIAPFSVDNLSLKSRPGISIRGLERY
jgi:hypothetical protein